jgi:hypothetical protein
LAEKLVAFNSDASVVFALSFTRLVLSDEYPRMTLAVLSFPSLIIAKVSTSLSAPLALTKVLMNCSSISIVISNGGIFFKSGTDGITLWSARTNVTSVFVSSNVIPTGFSPDFLTFTDKVSPNTLSRERSFAVSYTA